MIVFGAPVIVATVRPTQPRSSEAASGRLSGRVRLMTKPACWRASVSSG
jgi:hypothetical protein